MNWLPVVIIIAAVAAVFLLKRLTLVRQEVVRDSLRQGAKVIDVRTEAEFKQGHIAGAINIPLDRLGDEIPTHAPDKQQPVLLHCLSGGRSGVAKMILKRLGYHRPFNLGSFSRAQKLIEAAGKAPNLP